MSLINIYSERVDAAWHGKDELISKVEQVKQKQKGQERMLLPSVEGHQGGNWIVIDSGGFLVRITVT